MDQPLVRLQRRIRQTPNSWDRNGFSGEPAERPKELKDGAWIFQQEITVNDPKGRPSLSNETTLLDLSRMDPS
jgi:hypothetical protein